MEKTDMYLHENQQKIGHNVAKVQNRKMASCSSVRTP